MFCFRWHTPDEPGEREGVRIKGAYKEGGQNTLRVENPWAGSLKGGGESTEEEKRILQRIEHLAKTTIKVILSCSKKRKGERCSVGSMTKEKL